MCVPPRAVRILQVSRQMRQDALPLILSRIRYDIRFLSRDGHRTVDRIFSWLRILGPPNNDSLRNVSITLYEIQIRCLEHLFNTIARLPRVSLRLNTTLFILGLADSERHMALQNMHGFTHASFVNWNGGFEICDRHRHYPWEEDWEDLHQRFQNAVTKLMSPCPGNSCKVHSWRSPHHATSSVEIGWQMSRICHIGNCVSGGLLAEHWSWTPGRNPSSPWMEQVQKIKRTKRLCFFLGMA